MPQHIFLYGTLRRELCPSGMRPLVARLEPVSLAWVAGRLYDLGRYPGAVPDASAATRIVGEVCRLPADADALLAELDAYEGYQPRNLAASAYLRVAAEVTLAAGAGAPGLACWLYAWRGNVAGATLVPHGDYVAWRRQRR